MRRNRIAVAVVGGVLLGIAGMSGGADAAPKPVGGANSKLVELVEFEFELACDGDETLTVEGTGFIQQFPRPNGIRNVGHVVYHINVTYTNDDGESWVWRDRGPDRFFFIDGELHIAIIGRSAGSGVIGRVVFNTVTGVVVSINGNPVGEGGEFAVDNAACEALT